MNNFFRVAVHPTPEVEKFDTSLRYTDILFGFVIRELFLRLQNWPQLNIAVRLHLVVGATLVLGSWIGFRRSVHRSGYQVKFFNLPFFRFIIDQLMLILYFRIAVLTPVDGKGFPAADQLATNTTKLVAYIYILYVVWDVLGIWMAKAKITQADGTERPLYPLQPTNFVGFLITVVSMVVIVVLHLLGSCFTPNHLFLGTIAFLLVYRWAKEIRTTCRSPQPA